MIGMVLVAHEHIGTEMLRGVEHVLGAQALTASLDIASDVDIEVAKETLSKLIRRCDTGDGVLLFADMFGGTPCNLALSCMQDEDHKVEVISGANLPMLITAASKRRTDTDLPELARKVRDAGCQHIYLASELMTQKRKSHA